MSEHDILPNTPELPGDIDVDISASDMVLGPEIEYPMLHDLTDDEGPSDDDVYMASLSYYSGAIRDEVTNASLPNVNVTTDGSAGTEVAPVDPISLGYAPEWYFNTIRGIEELSEDYTHQPCGQRQPRAERNPPSDRITAGRSGLHIHMSNISDEMAQGIYDFSVTPHGRLFVGSAIGIMKNGQVFANISRDYNTGPKDYQVGGKLDETPDRDRWRIGNSVMKRRNEPGTGYRSYSEHWEWRKPGPMTAEHFHLVCMYLRIAEQDTDAAAAWASELVDRGDERITSFGRFEKIRDVLGIEGKSVPINTRPDNAEDITEWVSTASKVSHVDAFPKNKADDYFENKGEGADELLSITEA